MLSLRWKLCLVPKGSEQLWIVISMYFQLQMQDGSSRIRSFSSPIHPQDVNFGSTSSLIVLLKAVYKQPLVLRQSYRIPLYVGKSCLQVQPQETDTALRCSTLFFSCPNSSFHLLSMVKRNHRKLVWDLWSCHILSLYSLAKRANIRSYCHKGDYILQTKKNKKTFNQNVKTSPAAAGPNPFAGHFLFPVPALNHFKMSAKVFHTFMINDQLNTKIWPSKAQTISKITTIIQKHSSHTNWDRVTREQLSESLQLELHPSTCYCISDDFVAIPSTALRNLLPTWSLADACTSVLAGCFHFTLPHGCCLFFFAKVCLVANGPRYILSAFWQCNFKDIS